jgi:hypothetical protein
MSWAFRRRFLIIGGVILVLIALLGGWLFLATREAPSCTDRKQNQKEEGTDCGGPCPYLCNSSITPPRADYARVVSGTPGRIDVIASVTNPNAGVAAVRVPYLVELYDSANVLVASHEGTIDLPPSSVVPLFVPNVAQGGTAARAFLTFDEPAIRWFRYVDSRTLPRVVRSDYRTAPSPRVEALVQNPAVSAVANVSVIVTVFDASNTAIAASSTVIPYLAPGAEAPAIFTWSAPWSAAPARIEVEPVLPLSSP